MPIREAAATQADAATPKVLCTGVAHERLQTNSTKSLKCMATISKKGFFYRGDRWFHVACTKYVEPESKGSSCSACAQKWKSIIRKDRLGPECMIIFEGQSNAPPTGRVTESQIQCAVLYAAHLLGSITAIPTVKEESDTIAHLLQAAKVPSCEVEYQGRLYRISYCVDCLSNRKIAAIFVDDAIHSRRTIFLCDPCKNQNRNKERRVGNAEGPKKKRKAVGAAGSGEKEKTVRVTVERPDGVQG